MSKRLLMLNALLVGASAGLIAYIGWQVASPKTDTPGRRASGAPVASTATAPAATDRSGGAFGTIASRNLFSPDRTESASANASNALAALPKPSLHGVILRDGAPVAYLEDPITKRVAGYRVGDSVAGGTLQSISEDRVILTRPEGQVDVRLHDPTAAGPPAPGAPRAPRLTQRPGPGPPPPPRRPPRRGWGRVGPGRAPPPRVSSRPPRPGRHTRRRPHRCRPPSVAASSSSTS